MLITQAPKGTKDLLPKDVYRWQHMEAVMRSVCRSFGFREIRVRRRKNLRKPVDLLIGSLLEAPRKAEYQ